MKRKGGMGDSRAVKRRKKTESSIEEGETLPVELITDVLSRLPVKSLLRFRCVCKQWRSVISDLHFINLHFERAKRDPKLIISPRGHQLQEFHIFENDGQPIQSWKIVVTWDSIPASLSCNGLVCFADRNGIFVCNPSTREIKPLPKSTLEPSLFCGFGFDPSTNQYKVVKFMSSRSYFSLKCEILTLGDNSWRKLGFIRCPLCRQPPIFVSGTLHWKCWNGRGCYQIVSFDIGKEKLGVVPHPDCLSSKCWTSLGMVELGGYLCLIDTQLANPRLMDLWMLKDYTKNVWIKESIVFPSAEIRTLPLAIQNDQVLVFICQGKLLYYNLQSKSFMMVEGKADGDNFSISNFVGVDSSGTSISSHVDSLIPLVGSTMTHAVVCFNIRCLSKLVPRTQNQADLHSGGATVYQ